MSSDRRGLRRRLTWTALAGCALVAAPACDLEKVEVPRPEKRLALHAVLSPSASTQVVLLERTRNGSVYLYQPSFELEDPIGSDDGIAETGAAVALTTPSGDTFVAREDAEGGGVVGRGVYRFYIPGWALERRLPYKLSVLTLQGETMSAETVVPMGVSPDTADKRTFDRTGEPLVLEWAPEVDARSYYVRIETPFGPRAFFTDSTRVRLTGDLRNPEVAGVPRVFFPGFPQAVTVSAVDSNFYDWYRTHNDALAGTGVINRVRGGLGVFGSLVRLRFQELQVVVPQTEAPAGNYRFVGTDDERRVAPYSGIDLYVESRAARADQGDALSGRAYVPPRLGYTGCLTCGTLGTIRNGHVELALLSGWSARDTVDVLVGDVHGDTLVGRYKRRGDAARFVRQR